MASNDDTTDMHGPAGKGALLAGVSHARRRAAGPSRSGVQRRAARLTGAIATEAVECVPDGSVRRFVGCGAGSARAMPDRGRSDGTWKELELKARIATMANRLRGGNAA